MSDTVQQIKEKLHIADVLRAYLELRPAGRNMKALCPFHKEKTPSFMVSPDREMWYCFGCAEGGDMFKFVMKYENLEFFEAMKILAEKAGVEVRVAIGSGDSSKEIYEINEIAKDFFVSQLWIVESAHRDLAVKYLKERGLKEETIREFEIGLAPTASDALLRHLVAQKRTLANIERAGIVFKSERGTYWDRFRDRLIFPLYNGLGKVIGFTGRILPSDIPVFAGASAGKPATGFESAKYVNSPETPVFNKSKLLYGFNKSKNYIRDARTAIVVEGQMDFLMSWQDGVRNAIASSGTALTEEHLSHLRRLADNLLLCFDSDEAGQAAAERSIDLANANDFNVKLITITGGAKDPADVVVSSPGKLAEFVAKARPAMDWYFDRYLLGKNDIAGKKIGVRLALEKIKRLSSPVAREHYVRELSLRSSFSAAVLTEEMTAIAAPQLRARPSASLPPLRLAGAENETSKSRKDKIIERLLAVIYGNPDFKKEAEAVFVGAAENYKILFASLGEKGFAALPEPLAPLADLIALQSSFSPTAINASDAIDWPRREFRELLASFKTVDLKNRREEVGRKIAELDRAGDVAASAEALLEFKNLT